MNIESIIEFIKEETPENEKLLNMTYASIYNLLKTEQDCIVLRISELLSERDYIKVNEYVQMSKNVTDLLEVVENLDKKYVMHNKEEVIFYEGKELIEESDGKGTNLVNEKRINYEEFRVDENRPFSLMTDFRYMKPAAFLFEGVRYPARLWKLVFLKTCELLWEKNNTIFEGFISDRFMQGKTRVYFSKDKKAVTKPELVNGTEIFVETNLSANNIRDIIIKMLEKYSIPTEEYQIYLSKDLTPLHKDEIKSVISEDENNILEDTKKTCNMEEICDDFDIKTGKCLNENSLYFVMECCKQEKCSYIRNKKKEKFLNIYVLPKRELKKRICPKCESDMEKTVFVIEFQDNGVIKKNNVYGCWCKNCKTPYITEGTYGSFIRNKNLENINANFLKIENGQLSLF